MKVLVPPIKCQGIKTKLVPHIIENIKWSRKGRWIEPFLGSGVVVLNVNPERAILNDVNPHIITFYKQLFNGDITATKIREVLTNEGTILKDKGEEYYYFVRDRFNQNKGSKDFIFLNRSCFNGVMRFNGSGRFNVPFGHKPERFRQAYVTKITNQISNFSDVMQNKNWSFHTKDWREILAMAKKDDFVYLDPPYIGRHTDYYNNWTEKDAKDMVKLCKKLPCPFIVSMWKKNKYRENEHLKEWSDYPMVTINHFYHVGSSESLRNEMEEVLILGNMD